MSRIAKNSQDKKKPEKSTDAKININNDPARNRKI